MRTHNIYTAKQKKSTKFDVQFWWWVMASEAHLNVKVWCSKDGVITLYIRVVEKMFTTKAFGFFFPFDGNYDLQGQSKVKSSFFNWNPYFWHQKLNAAKNFTSKYDLEKWTSQGFKRSVSQNDVITLKSQVVKKILTTKVFLLTMTFGYDLWPQGCGSKIWDEKKAKYFESIMIRWIQDGDGFYTINKLEWVNDYDVF